MSTGSVSPTAPPLSPSSTATPPPGSSGRSGWHRSSVALAGATHYWITGEDKSDLGIDESTDGLRDAESYEREQAVLDQ